MYTIIVTKLPQEADDALAQKVVSYANERKRTIVYSLDDCVRLMNNQQGNSYSHVEIVHPEVASQVETILELEAQGILWEELVIDELPYTTLSVSPNYSQNDPQWRNHPLGDGSVPNKTIGNWGCLGTVYATMARYMSLCSDLPDEFNDRMVASGAMYSIYVQAGALQTCFPYKVSYKGWYTTDVVQRCKDQINKGIPVPARVDLDPSASYTQHWVLIIGYSSEDELIVADPYPYQSTIKPQSRTIYDKIHEVLIYDYKHEEPVPPTEKYDLAPYFSTVGNSQTFELQTYGGGQERVQLKQYSGGVSHITKNSLYEELRVTGSYIQRSIDTSMDNDHFYYLGEVGGYRNWLKRHMELEEQFMSEVVVTVKRKSDCGTVSVNGTKDYLTFKAHHNTFEGFNGVVINDVIEVEWRKSPNGKIEEVYYFANGLGLVGWGTTDGTGRVARISELHPIGARPDNEETYYCGWGI